MANRTLRMTDVALRAIFIVVAAILLGNINESVAATLEPLSACPSVDEEILDLQMLSGALRDTKAVGTMTKIRLKSDINKVLKRLENWHAGKTKFTLDELEEQYNLLLMKIATLINDRDQVLHQQICNSWVGLWLDLKDPDSFRKIRS
jgi:hypothetical protein